MALPSPAPDRTALVTGASSGIGAEIARQLAIRRHGIVLVARRAEPMRLLAEELADRGVRAEVLVADLSDATDRTRLLADVDGLGLTVDILVNNAGFGTSGAVFRADPEREGQMIRTNVEAVVDLTTRLLPGMVERGQGGVLNVASTAAFQPLPGQAAYAASKAFVLSYTEALRGELRGTGVTATVLCPGPVQTEFVETAGLSEEEARTLPSFMWVSAERVAEIAVEGLDQGKGVVIPGTVNRLGAVAAHLAPRRFLVPMLSHHPSLRRSTPSASN